MKHGLIKTGISILLLMGIFQANLQAQVGAWKYYRAYQNATIVAETPHLVFAVYDGSLLSYNPEDQEVKLYSTQTGLSDINIQLMAYSSECNALVLVYGNANIDIFTGENEIYNLSFIKNNLLFPNKAIYNLEIYGKFAYISTAFGIIVVDIVRKEVKNIYRLDMIVRSVCFWGDYILAATDAGIKRALTSSNLLDKASWKPYEDLTLSAIDATGVEKILVFNDHLVYENWYNVNYLVSPQNVVNLSINTRQVSIINNRLVIASAGEVDFYSDFNQVQRLSLDIQAIDCLNSANRYWVCLAGDGGLAAIDKQDNAAGYIMAVDGIKVDSPKRNLNFFMTFTAGKLLITGGGRGSDRSNIPGTLMVYENGHWTNFDENKIAQDAGIPAPAPGVLPCRDFMSAAVDPTNANHYFVGSWGEGLYEFRDNQFVNRYNHLNTNGGLQSPAPNTDNYTRISGLVYDKNNNLFMVNGDVLNGMVEFSANGQWKNFYIQPISENPYPDKILIDKNNYKWLNIWRYHPAMIVLDENNQMVGFSNTFADQLGTNIGATAYLCMAEALDGTVWVGTDIGPIQFTSIQQVTKGTCNRIVSQDQYGDNFYPLINERINAIAIDGGDRKWLGSENSGVYLIEQSGGTTNIENFNISNSPILSNKINSIAIDNATGEVFIGTDKGLCSYMSHVTPGKPDFSSNVHAFPNPVRPATDTQVSITGLMQNSMVKITDVAGNLINQGQSTGSLFTWNLTNRSGGTVKAGIYLVFAASPDGSQGVVTKIMVIK